MPPAQTRCSPDGLALPAGDFAWGAGWGYAAGSRTPPYAQGILALLCTREDRRLGWLLAGEARQPLPLHVAGHRVSASFYTQPLERPWTRERIGAKFTGAHTGRCCAPGRSGRPSAACAALSAAPQRGKLTPRGGTGPEGDADSRGETGGHLPGTDC